MTKGRTGLDTWVKNGQFPLKAGLHQTGLRALFDSFAYPVK